MISSPKRLTDVIEKLFGVGARIRPGGPTGEHVESSGIAPMSGHLPLDVGDETAELLIGVDPGGAAGGGQLRASQQRGHPLPGWSRVVGQGDGRDAGRFGSLRQAPRWRASATPHRRRLRGCRERSS